MARRVHEYSLVMIVSCGVLAAAYTLCYVSPTSKEEGLFGLLLALWQEVPFLVLWGLVRMLRRAFGPKAADPWILAMVLILTAIACWAYLMALRPFDPKDPGFEPNLVFLFSPIDLTVFACICSACVAVILKVKSACARKRSACMQDPSLPG